MNKFVSNGTVFQEAIYETTATSNSIISEKERRVIDLSDYRIRELDFKILDGNGPYEDNSYKSYVTSNELGLILSQKSSVISSKTMRWRILPRFVLLPPFQSMERSRNLKKGMATCHHTSIRSNLKIHGAFAAKHGKPVTVTQAFRLQLITKRKEWIKLKEIEIPDSDFCHYMAEILQLQPSFAKLTFAKDQPHLEFMIRRNLEHILSVCSIPIPDKGIALTCGDMSGHRLVTSATL
jgi:hypothetical protein